MPRRTTPRVSEAVERFITIRSAQLARQTCINDRALLNRLARTTGDPQLHQLTRLHLEEHFLALAGQKPSSWNKERSRLRTFFEWCTRYGWIDTDLLADIRPKRVVREKRLRLSQDQLLRLLDVPDPRDRAFIALAENTALRASTITSLTVGDLHLAQGYLHVFVTKSAYEDELPITSDLDAEMRRWLVHYAQELGRPLRDDDLLVPARTAPKPQWMKPGAWADSYGDLQTAVRICKPANIIKRALQRQLGIETVRGEGVHTVRRSIARIVFDHASDNGHDSALRVAAALLGHNSTQTTEIYLGIDRDRQKRDELLKGHSLFPRDTQNVVELRPREAVR